ncbi:MAG: hypothetical protein ACLUEQ_07235 [Cloacibacillus evryensis]
MGRGFEESISPVPTRLRAQTRYSCEIKKIDAQEGRRRRRRRRRHRTARL